MHRHEEGHTSFGNKEIFELENKLGMISKWTCIRCGKQPKNSKGQHIIWRTTGWICPYYKECFEQGSIVINCQNASEEEAERMARKIIELIKRQRQIDGMMSYA